MATNSIQTDTSARGTIAAYFPTHSAAQLAVTKLRAAGFTSSQIGYAGRTGLDPSTSATGAAAYEQSTGAAGSSTTQHTGEGAWAKIKNFFEGGDVEPYADEKDRGSAQARELVPEDVSNRGSNSGYDPEDLHGSFADLSIPEQHSKYFGHRLGTGEEGAVVTVRAEGREADAEEILHGSGGDLGTGSSEYDYAQAAPASPAEGTQRIQLLGEVLRVHTDRVSRGEVRLRKEVITEQQTVQVPVSHEELVLERVSGAGLTPVAGVIGGGDEIRIPLSEEQARVEKQTVVREEYAVGKRAVEGVSTVDSAVEHEELAVENTAGNGPGGTGREKL